jgi:alginate O-acetyltransferase complex protein AlgI
MTFTSWQFGVFVTVVFGLYYLPALRNFQVQLLVLASVFFYGYGQPELLPLLLVAVLGTWLFLALALRNRAIWLPGGIAFNLALLAFFKYKFLFVDSASALTGVTPVDFLLKLPLPIGISFFVFHNISLLVDLTRDNRNAPRLADIFLYIIFFPQLVSGPITRAAQFMPQIVPKRVGDVDFVEAAKWILAGYFFKLFVANNLNEMTSYMAFPLYETLRTQDRGCWFFSTATRSTPTSSATRRSLSASGWCSAIACRSISTCPMFRPRSPSSGPAGTFRYLPGSRPISTFRSAPTGAARRGPISTS